MAYTKHSSNWSTNYSFAVDQCGPSSLVSASPVKIDEILWQYISMRQFYREYKKGKLDNNPVMFVIFHLNIIRNK